jgi:tetratricopeptide (TPR) repeat protein
MNFLSRFEQKLQSFTTQGIKRAIWVVLIALTASLALFGGYYYWDRYVHLGDKSPLELDIERMEEVIRRDPQNPDARVALAEYYLNKGTYEEALAQASQVLRLYPESEGALLISGMAYQASGQPEAALERYHQAVRFVPDFTEVFGAMIESYTALERSDYVGYARGMEALCLQDYETAQSHLEQVTETLPDFAPAFLGLGLMYERVGDLQAALTAIQQVLGLDPDNSAARQALGRVQAAMNARQG